MKRPRSLSSSSKSRSSEARVVVSYVVTEKVVSLILEEEWKHGEYHGTEGCSLKNMAEILFPEQIKTTPPRQCDLILREIGDLSTELSTIEWYECMQKRRDFLHKEWWDYISCVFFPLVSETGSRRVLVGTVVHHWASELLFREESLSRLSLIVSTTVVDTFE